MEAKQYTPIQRNVLDQPKGSQKPALLSRIYNMTLASKRHERRGKNAFFHWSK